MKYKSVDTNDENESPKKIEKPNHMKYYEYIFFSIIAIFFVEFNTIKLGFTCFGIAKKFNFELNGLTEGFSFLGGHRDYSDFQWRYFRQNLHIFVIFAAIFISISKILKKLDTMIGLKIFYAVVGVCFGAYLHRIRLIYLLLALLGSYSLTKLYSFLGKKVFIVLTWIYVVIVKITSEIWRGYGVNFLDFPNYLKDPFFGWQLVFGLIMLRLISFNVEYSNLRENDTKSNYFESVAKMRTHCNQCKEGKFCTTALKFSGVEISDFSFLNLIIYVFYPAFYLSGPTVMFHSFIFQLKNFKQNSHNDIIDKNKIIYVFRVLFVFVIFEIFNHFIYVNAFITNPYNKSKLEETINNMAYYNLYFLAQNDLIFLWLKYAFMWKISRLWGWMDGILAEENMNRCVYNNYNFESFWRAWHRSFNIWLIRYIYIPLGGKNKKLLNTFVVFSFVALWHDLKLNLLIWGWFIYICIVPEIVIKSYFAKEKNKYLENHFWFRILSHLGCTLYMILLAVANLIGFGIGSSEVVEILFKLLNNLTPLRFLLICFSYFPLSYLLYYIREIESFYGIKKNY